MVRPGRARGRTRPWPAIAASVVAFTLVAIAGARAVRAQNAEAELLFRDGAQLMDAGEYAKACDAFEASNRIEPRAGTLLRLGHCREQNRQYASAWSAYSDALARVQDPAKRQIAEASVAALADRLSFVTIDVPEERRVAGLVITRGGRVVDAALWNRAAPVDGGDHEIVARAPGHESWTVTITIAAERDQVVVAVPRLRTTAPVGARPLLTKRRTIALGVAGAGAVFLVVGALNGTQVRDLEGQAHDLCGTEDDTCDDFAAANDHLDDARGKARLANISFGLAAVSLAGAAALWLTGGARPSDGIAITPAVAPGVAGAVVRGRF